MSRINNVRQCLNKVTFSLGVMLVSVTPATWGQPAPALRAVVPADAAPEAMAKSFATLGSGERTISMPGAAWLQLQFSDVRLGPEGVLTIMDASGESQTFSQTQIDAWGGLSAVFNGSELRVRLQAGPGAAQPVWAKIKEIIIGLPASAVSGTEVVTPQPLRNLLGPDIKRFIRDDLRELKKGGAAPPQGGVTEAICGATDDRVPSTNPRAGRIMPIGCTGWLIDGGNLLTAGHCIGAATQTVEFNVPASQADGTPVAPPVRDQYRVVAGSIVSQFTGVGNDWAVFQVLPNTQTSLMPAAAQGATFQLSNTDNPAQVRITGFGVDGPPPSFGAGGPRNAQNQTQQTHVGALSGNTGGATSGVLNYNTDTQGGNSGSPVIVEGGNVAIGIHTNGGCTPTGGTNAGTSFRNAAAWTAINAARTDWQITNSTIGDFAGWAATSGVKVLTGDFNNDGRTDVALLRQSGGWATMPVAFANGDGSWRITNSGIGSFAGWAATSGVQVLTGDFNSDGRTDVALIRQSGGWATMPVAFANGDGSWRITNSGIGSFAGWAATSGVKVLTGDFNHDGRTDVALIRQSGGWATMPVAFANGDGSWRITNRGIGSFAGWAATSGVKVLTGDFNHDGHTDVALLRQSAGWATMPVAFANGDGSWRITNSGIGSFAGWAATSGVKVLTGDFNHDGHTDVALVRQSGGWATMPVAFANGDGSWRITNSSTGSFAGWAATSGVQVLTGDFNSDGRTDVALLRQSAGWATLPVAFANGDGSWRITNSGVGSFAGWAATSGVKVLTGDFNHDGRTDVALLRQLAGWATMPVAFAP